MIYPGVEESEVEYYKTPDCDTPNINGKIGGFSCQYYKILIFIMNFNLGYICLVLLGIIILISIFGGIKEHYRWFILNQTFWDLWVSYSFICENNILSWIYDQPSSCFYSPGDEYNFSYDTKLIDGKNPFMYYLGKFINICVEQHSYSSLLLLSFTRFLCLYFMNFYDKLTRKRRIYYLIIIFNLIFIFTILAQLGTANILGRFGTSWEDDCKKKYCKTFKTCKWSKYDKCKLEYEKNFQYELINVFYSIFRVIYSIKPSLSLIISWFFAFMIIARIFKQMKFQIKHNKRDFMNSARISLVLFLQSSLNLIILFFESSHNIYFQFYYWFYTADPSENECGDIDCSSPDSGLMDIEWPAWLDDRGGMSNPMSVQMLRQIRVLLESIIVLSIMTGYREAIIKFIKFLYYAFKNPRETYRKGFSNFSRSKISFIS